MKITEYAIKYPQITWLFFAIIVLLGGSTIMNISRSEDPELSSPEFPVIVVYPGANPVDMENLVVEPIEQKLSSLEGIKKITSSTGDGFAMVYVVYKHGSNVDEKYQEVIREVNNLRQELPSEIYSIDIQKWLPSNVNVIQASLISENAPMETMRKEAKRLKEDLEKIEQLKNVKIFGLPERRVHIEVQLNKLNQMHIPIEALIGSIKGEAVNIPGGQVDAGRKVFSVQTSGNYAAPEEIANTIIFSSNGKNVYLKDVAEVKFDYKDATHITRLNGHRCLFVVAAQKPGENISATQKLYAPVIENFKKTLPKNIDLIQQFDQAENVNARLGGLGLDFLFAIGLVAITLLPLGYRAALIVMISIPLSLAIGIIMINLFGYNLNQLSIVGFVVALGLLVDDSIVVVENIERWLRDGYTLYEATVKATKQIGMAVLGCTATLMIAFLPLIFLPGASGDFIRSLPMAVVSCVFASLIVAMTIIPFLSNKLLKVHSGSTEGNIFLRLLQKAISGTYSRWLNSALRHPVITGFIALGIFAGSLSIIPVVGFSLFPPSEKPQFMINVISPIQSNLAYTDELTKQIEAELKKIPEVQYFSTNVGHGNPEVYYNILTENDRSDFSQLFVQLFPKTKPAKKMEIIEKLQKKWNIYPNAKIEVKNFEQGPPVEAPVEVRLYGENLDSLRNLSLKIQQMLKETEGTIYINNPLENLKSDIKVDINKEKASQLGIPTVSIDQSVRLAITGFEAGKMIDKAGDSYKIVVTKEKQTNRSLDALDELYVSNLQGIAIPLNQVADLSFIGSPVTINHFNKIRTVTISASVVKGYLNDNVINAVDKKMREIKLPSGYSYKMAGELDQREESFGGFSSVIMLTVFLFVTVLLLEFGTYKSALIVLSVVPLGIVGAVLALYVTGNSLSFVAVIGLIALAGVEVKNTILLVDFTNQLRKGGKSLEDAIREAGEIRFLPIVLTSLTAIGGLFPIAISTNPLISPLAIVMIGGLISSTLLSRIVTPVVYKLIPPKVD